MQIKSFKDLRVWQESISFVKIVYELSSEFPNDEKFGLISQMRRAAISIPSNISEGFGRHSKKEYIHFLEYSLSSLFEIETQLIISKNLNYGYSANYDEVFEKMLAIKKMLYKFISNLKLKQP